MGRENKRRRNLGSREMKEENKEKKRVIPRFISQAAASQPDIEISGTQDIQKER